MPKWEQRIRAVALEPMSLIGDPVTWSADGRYGTVLANPSGRVEVHAFDASTLPARLTQVTDRPQGTTGGAISHDGQIAFYFDDTSGDETGRWVAVPLVNPTQSTVLLPDLPTAYNAGLVSLADGRVLMGRTTEAGFELALAEPDGSGRVVYTASDFGHLRNATPDGSVALISYDPNGDGDHPACRVIRTSDGTITAQLQEPNLKLAPIAFNPTNPDEVLVSHERHGWERPLVWHTTSGQQVEVEIDVEGEVQASWFPDGRSLLLTVLRNARHRALRWDRLSGKTTELPVPQGTIVTSHACPDGSVQALVSRSDQPVSLLRVTHEAVENMIDLPGAPPPPAVAAADVFAQSPGGQVHGLVYRPVQGAAPYPTIFFIHGGPTFQDYDGWHEVVAAYVDQGYAVVRVNYRGSTGYGAAWRESLRKRLGFIELEDIGAIRHELESAGVIDPDRVAITGFSWGGYLTLMALGTQPKQWRSGAALVPLADWIVSHEDGPAWMTAYDRVLLGGTIEQVPEVYHDTSPITYVDDVIAPLFVTGAESDPRCPVRQIDGYVERLRARGHPVTYDRLDGGHGMLDVEMLVTEVRKVIAFFKATLPVN